MDYNYKRTFDAIHLSTEHQQQIRSELVSNLAKRQEENKNIKPNIKVKHIFVAAAIAVMMLALAGFAFGSQIIHLLSGGQFVNGIDEDGNHFTSMETGFVKEPVEIRNGRIYFILDELDLDITEYCTKETYYQYERIDNEGNRNIVIVGGMPDNLGWAEFVWAIDGTTGISGTYNDDTPPAWFIAAKKAFEN